MVLKRHWKNKIDFWRNVIRSIDQDPSWFIKSKLEFYNYIFFSYVTNTCDAIDTEIKFKSTNLFDRFGSGKPPQIFLKLLSSFFESPARNCVAVMRSNVVVVTRNCVSDAFGIVGWGRSGAHGIASVKMFKFVKCVVNIGIGGLDSQNLILNETQTETRPRVKKFWNSWHVERLLCNCHFP